MAKDIAIKGNTAGAGATQINNVNITPCKLQMTLKDPSTTILQIRADAQMHT